MENSQLLEYIGETKTKKLQDSITKEYFELFHKKFPAYNENHKMNSLVTVTDKKEIKSIGMSCINDLINDNWGKMIKALISGDLAVIPPAVDRQNTTNNALIVYRTTDQFNSTNTAGLVGSVIQAGSGSTPATRQDFNIETALIGLPQATFNPTGDGSWSSGLGQILIPSQIVAGQGGTIRETVLFGNWATISPVENQQYCISRDLISPIVNFVIGQTINIDYTMVFN